MRKAYVVVFYDSESSSFSELSFPVYVTNQSIESVDNLSADALCQFDEFKKNLAPSRVWTHFLLYRYSKLNIHLKTGVTVLVDSVFLDASSGDLQPGFTQKININRETFEAKVEDAKLEKELREGGHIPREKEEPSTPLLSHVNAGCSLAASIALLAVSAYLVEQAATVTSMGFEVGAGIACVAFVGCVVWAVFALMSYAHVKKTGDNTDGIKGMLVANLSKDTRPVTAAASEGGGRRWQVVHDSHGFSIERLRT